MIPLKDINRSSTIPFATILLIILNGMVFLYELSLGRALTKFFYIYGVVPSFYFNSDYWATTGLLIGALPLFTSMFLHAGWLHFLGNMLYLWVFGRNVEDLIGSAKFLVFYILCGLIAAVVHAPPPEKSPPED